MDGVFTGSPPPSTLDRQTTEVVQGLGRDATRIPALEAAGAVGQAAKRRPHDTGGAALIFGGYFFLAAWTSISASMPGATRAATCMVTRAGLLGCSAVPKNCL